MRQRGWIWSLGLLGILLLGWGASRGVDLWRSEAMLSKARQAIERGEFAKALPWLTWLSTERLGQGEAALLLGDCEVALGHPEAALTAWARVPSNSPWATEADLCRGRQAIETGRLAEAEEALIRVINKKESQATEARELLIRLFWREARFDEVSALIETHWDDLRRTSRLSTIIQ